MAGAVLCAWGGEQFVQLCVLHVWALAGAVLCATGGPTCVQGGVFAFGWGQAGAAVVPQGRRASSPVCGCLSCIRSGCMFARWPWPWGVLCARGTERHAGVCCLGRRRRGAGGQAGRPLAGVGLGGPVPPLTLPPSPHAPSWPPGAGGWTCILAGGLRLLVSYGGDGAGSWPPCAPLAPRLAVCLAYGAPAAPPPPAFRLVEELTRATATPPSGRHPAAPPLPDPGLCPCRLGTGWRLPALPARAFPCLTFLLSCCLAEELAVLPGATWPRGHPAGAPLSPRFCSRASWWAVGKNLLLAGGTARLRPGYGPAEHHLVPPLPVPSFVPPPSHSTSPPCSLPCFPFHGLCPLPSHPTSHSYMPSC
uniref:Uncharacterized protein n=1 Tax=Chelonoidis abingdonii TaxID=106734 RepID=A0A8C0GEY8_CHEAB